jgi:hypothetical protein
MINVYYPCYHGRNNRRDLTTGKQVTTAGPLTPHLSLPIDKSFIARSDVFKDVVLRMHVLQSVTLGA